MKTRNRYRNPNPLKKETGDCVVRALSIATETSWDKVYCDLFNIGFELKVMPNSDEAWKQYLINNEYSYFPLKAEKGKKRMNVDRFTRTKEYQNGEYVLKVANHIVAIVDGYSYDIWDCSNKCVYGYWTKQ